MTLPPSFLFPFLRDLISSQADDETVDFIMNAREGEKKRGSEEEKGRKGELARSRGGYMTAAEIK